MVTVQRKLITQNYLVWPESLFLHGLGFFNHKSRVNVNTSLAISLSFNGSKGSAFSVPNLDPMCRVPVP